MAQSPEGAYDVAIVGAGVVGCALARRLTLEGARVVVLEKAAEVLDGASKGNSAILHTGFDAPLGSLERDCMAEGYGEFLEIRESLGLPLLETGALVLAWSEAELARLEGLIEKAQANGVTDVAPLTRHEILAREPNLSEAVLGGFRVPGEHIIDPWSTPHAYILQALLNGAELWREAELLSGSFEGDAWRLETTRGAVRAGQVVSCAGLYGDRVDERLLGRALFQIRPRKGQFLVFDKAAAGLVSAILLPVPGETTKGVVLCRTAFGNLLIGPTAEEQESREEATTEAETLRALQAKALAMVPALAEQEITASYAGLRPASEEKEYRIAHLPERRYCSVGGIRSTGLTAALGIARHVARLLAGSWTGEALADPVLPAPIQLAAEGPRDWQSPGNGGILCHCELVTRREIEAALSGPMPARTLAGLKRRTRVCMGRCQGFYCLGALAALTRGRLEPPIAQASDAA